MGELVTVSSGGGALQQFDPRKTLVMVGGLENAVRQARAMRDWAAGEAAIDELIALQAAFVAWWDANVSPGELLGTKHPIAESQQGPLPASEAKAQTGIAPWHVSRWRQRLRDPQAYRLLLRKSLQTVAMSRDPAVEDIGETELPQGKYRTIVIDPPWDMKKIERTVRPNQAEFDYPTMTQQQLIEFPVANMADDNCHLFCWTTQKFLPDAMELLLAWGFNYIFLMTWHKSGGFQPHGLPQYNSEFVVYGRKGSPKFRDTKAFNTCFQGERREHSRKPDVFYDTIRRVTSDGRIDVFSREQREGFDQYGNQVGQFNALSA